jgi:hypothetical protein
MRTTEEVLAELAVIQEEVNKLYDILEQRALLVAEARSLPEPVPWTVLGRMLGMSPQGVAKIAATRSPMSSTHKDEQKSL